MRLLQKYQGIADRIERPAPIAERVGALFEAGKRVQLSLGVDAEGTPFAPLAASTLRYRGPGEPLDPPGSRIASGYRVEVQAEPARLVVRAGWPGVDFVQYHQSGTRNMPRRDPGGFRDEDRFKALEEWRGYIYDPGR
jgi:hypothetical protein